MLCLDHDTDTVHFWKAPDVCVVINPNFPVSSPALVSATYIQEQNQMHLNARITTTTIFIKSYQIGCCSDEALLIISMKER